jgi:hypothetical protein
VIATFLGNRLVTQATISASNWQSVLAAQRAAVKADLATVNYQLQPGDTLRTTWYAPGCFPHEQELPTEWNGTETRDELIDRHFDAVLAAMTGCPPG